MEKKNKIKLKSFPCSLLILEPYKRNSTSNWRGVLKLVFSVKLFEIVQKCSNLRNPKKNPFGSKLRILNF